MDHRLAASRPLTSNHNHTDAGVLAADDGLGDAHLGGVNQGNQTKESVAGVGDLVLELLVPLIDLMHIKPTAE